MIGMLLLILILISIPATAFLGSANISFEQVIDVYKYNVFGNKYPLENRFLNSIIWHLRLPRAIVAITVGGSLAIAGCVMQAMTSNVMAEPYTLGIQAGAGLFASLGIAVFYKIEILNQIGVNVFAFLGAMLAMLVVYSISAGGKNSTRNTLILVGISISMLCNALTQLVIAFAPDNAKLRSIVFWMMGELGGSRWNDVPFALGTYIAGFLLLYMLAEQLNILSMGEETAIILGIQTAKLNKLLFIIVSLIVGTMVSISGSIGFVGLIIPHITRKLFSANHKILLPISALLGSLFLIWTDTISRVIVAPRELPVGVLTSLIGVTSFLFILKNRDKRFA